MGRCSRLVPLRVGCRVLRLVATCSAKSTHCFMLAHVQGSVCDLDGRELFLGAALTDEPLAGADFERTMYSGRVARAAEARPGNYSAEVVTHAAPAAYLATLVLLSDAVALAVQLASPCQIDAQLRDSVASALASVGELLDRELCTAHRHLAASRANSRLTVAAGSLNELSRLGKALQAGFKSRVVRPAMLALGGGGSGLPAGHGARPAAAPGAQAGTGAGMASVPAGSGAHNSPCQQSDGGGPGIVVAPPSSSTAPTSAGTPNRSLLGGQQVLSEPQVSVRTTAVCHIPACYITKSPV